MLNDVKPGEIIGRGDIFEASYDDIQNHGECNNRGSSPRLLITSLHLYSQELLGTCKAAQPKIQKFISEAGDDEDMGMLCFENLERNL